jgi:hypothetical protein
MRTFTAAVFATTLAFLVGVSGVPGTALSHVTSWLTANGSVVLEGPVGDAVRVAFPEVDGEPADAE